MTGLHLLKHMKGLSDEETCATWLENPYFQAFRGETHFQHRLPIDRSSMTRWRQRIGADDLEALLAETIAVAVKTEAVNERQLERITVDTTVQTKAVAHPTDSHLILRAVEWLNRLAKRHGIKLRQSFLLLATRARREVARLLHGRGHKQGLRWLRSMRTWLGRLTRDIRRKIAGDPVLEAAFATVPERAERILSQQPGDKIKLYAFHAPEVECIHCPAVDASHRREGERARPAPATSSAARPPSPPQTSAARAAGSSSGPWLCLVIPMTATALPDRSSRWPA